MRDGFRGGMEIDETMQVAKRLECSGAHGLVLKVGDTVLYGKYAGTELEVEGTKYLIMRQSDVLAVLG